MLSVFINHEPKPKNSSSVPTSFCLPAPTHHGATARDSRIGSICNSGLCGHMLVMQPAAAMAATVDAGRNTQRYLPRILAAGPLLPEQLPPRSLAVYFFARFVVNAKCSGSGNTQRMHRLNSPDIHEFAGPSANGHHPLPANGVPGRRLQLAGHGRCLAAVDNLTQEESPGRLRSCGINLAQTGARP